MPHDLKTLREKAVKHKQEHLITHYDKLNSTQQKKLLEQIASIDFDLIDRRNAEFLKEKDAAKVSGKLEPPPVIPVPGTPDQKKKEQEARAAGEDAFRKGRVGCFLVAGG